MFFKAKHEVGHFVVVDLLYFIEALEILVFNHI